MPKMDGYDELEGVAMFEAEDPRELARRLLSATMGRYGKQSRTYRRLRKRLEDLFGELGPIDYERSI